MGSRRENSTAASPAGGTLTESVRSERRCPSSSRPTRLLAVPVFAFTGLLMPGLQGLMTRRVAPYQQGQLQGANQSLMGLSSIIGPVIFGEVFAWNS